MKIEATLREVVFYKGLLNAPMDRRRKRDDYLERRSGMTEQQRGTRNLEDILGKLQNQQGNIAGHVLTFIGNRRIRVLTNNTYKQNAGELGLPKGMFLVLCPTGEYAKKCYPHFILLRKIKVTEAPGSEDDIKFITQYIKKNRTLNNVFRQSDLEWDAFEASVVGAYRIDEHDSERIKFYRNTPSLGTGKDYTVYVPNSDILDIIANSPIVEEDSEAAAFPIGNLRISEFGSVIRAPKLPATQVHVLERDFVNTKTAIFGKSRMGKSNIGKTIALNMNRAVTQIIFDNEGEYCWPNPQDDNSCIADITPGAIIFGLSDTPQRDNENTPRENICPDFYLYPELGFITLKALLHRDPAGYVQSFLSVDVPSVEEVNETDDMATRTRAVRKIKIFWAILHRAQFELPDSLPNLRCGNDDGYGQFSLGLSNELLEYVYGQDRSNWPILDTPDKLIKHLSEVWERITSYENERKPKRNQEKQHEIFDGDDKSMLGFLFPRIGRAGTEKLKRCRKYHDANGGGGHAKVIEALQEGRTIFLDFSREDPELVQFHSEGITKAVYEYRKELFTNNDKEEFPRSVLMYYEEAHKLFPLRSIYNTEREKQTIYAQIAKEGARYGIGVIYITQSPSTIDNEIVDQTDNFFVVGMSSGEEVKTLIRWNRNFEDHESDILEAVDKGYMQILTRSNKFVVPVQANLFRASEQGRGRR